MLEESALVVKIDQYIWVVGTENNACAGCAQKAGCSSTALASLLKKKPVPVDSSFALQVGDKVIVAVDETVLLRATLWLYIVPLMALLTGAGIADWLVTDVTPDAEVWIAGSAFAGLGAALFIMQKTTLFNHYSRPVVVRKC